MHRMIHPSTSADDVQIYLVLVLLSPPPIVTPPSEKTYRSKASQKPLPLPLLAGPGSVDPSMIIPAYNETNRLLETTLTHLNSSVSNSSRTHEILIVDDEPKDDTSALALKLVRQYAQSDIRVITLEKNLGKGGALRHGMLHGRGHRLLMVDADGASRFEDLEQLWANMDEIAPQNEAAVAIGSRASREDRSRSQGTRFYSCSYVDISCNSQ